MANNHVYIHIYIFKPKHDLPANNVSCGGYIKNKDWQICLRCGIQGPHLSFQSLTQVTSCGVIDWRLQTVADAYGVNPPDGSDGRNGQRAGARLFFS